jgi:endo-1,4-beta-xylanase
MTNASVPRSVLLSLLAAMLATAAGCSSNGVSRASESSLSRGTTLAAPPDSLRALAARRGLLIGTAVDDTALQDEADYRRVLGDQFNLVEPENVMKWDVIHPAPNHYDFSGADRLVAFAMAHHMVVRGHNLAWGNQNPPWLENGHFSRAQAIAILRDHIQTVVGHFRGEIAQWDVVNEPLDASGNYSQNPWLRFIGPDYIAMAFRFAHEADPHAQLYLNEYDLSYPGPKAKHIVALVANLKRHGVPIDGLGMQFHVFPGLVNFAGVATQMRQVAALGLDYAVTEFDVALKLPATPAELRDEADEASSLLETCLAASNCHTFNMWGFTDRHSWIPEAEPGYGAATISDARLRPKPEWTALMRTLEG